MNFASILLAVLLQGYPDHTGVVNDFANVIDATSKEKIESVIHGLKEKADLRLVVVTADSLNGQSIEEYSAGLTAKWGIGQKGKNNGVLLIYAPHEHKVRIENGYGVESRLTDIESKSILHDKVAPLTKSGRIGEGLLAGVQAISDLMSQPGKEPEPAPIASGTPASSGPGPGTLFGGAFILGGIIVLIYLWVTRETTQEVAQPYSPPEPDPMPWLTDPPRRSETPSIIPPLIAGAALGALHPRPPSTFVPPPVPPPARQEEDDDDEKESSSGFSFGGSSEKDDDYSSGSSSSSDDDSFAGGDSGGGGATEDA